MTPAGEVRSDREISPKNIHFSSLVNITLTPASWSTVIPQTSGCRGRASGSVPLSVLSKVSLRTHTPLLREPSDLRGGGPAARCKVGFFFFFFFFFLSFQLHQPEGKTYSHFTVSREVNQIAWSVSGDAWKPKWAVPGQDARPAFVPQKE